MTPEVTLDAIARGDTAAQEARTFIAGCLRDEAPEVLRQLYTALRMWTWKALMSRRTDADLDGWFEIIRGLQAYTEDRDNLTSNKFSVLCELVEDSIRFREGTPHEALLKRRHMRPLLTAIRRHNGAWVERRELIRELQLGEANLSTLLSTLVSAGKVERELDGRDARFRLSIAGFALADELAEDHPVQAATAPAVAAAVTPPALHATLEKLKRARNEIDSSISSLEREERLGVGAPAQDTKAPKAKTTGGARAKTSIAAVAEAAERSAKNGAKVADNGRGRVIKASLMHATVKEPDPERLKVFVEKLVEVSLKPKPKKKTVFHASTGAAKYKRTRVKKRAPRGQSLRATA